MARFRGKNGQKLLFGYYFTCKGPLRPVSHIVLGGRDRVGGVRRDPTKVELLPSESTAQRERPTWKPESHTTNVAPAYRLRLGLGLEFSLYSSGEVGRNRVDAQVLKRTG